MKGVVWAVAAVFLTGCGASVQKEAPKEQKSPTVSESAPAPSLGRAKPEASRSSKAPGPPRLETRTIILTYHDMVPERGPDTLWFDCTPEELRDQIAWLYEQKAVFVNLEQVREALAGGPPLPDRAVALCFADNYQGFYDHAWPILKEEDIPATLFVHTGHVGSQKGRPKMTWDTLKELLESGLIHVESQTVSHPKDLASLSQATLKRELFQSRDDIESHLGFVPTMIAYPNGKFSRQVSQSAWEAGYEIGFTEEQEPAELAPTLMEVPRYVHTKMKEAWREARSGSRSGP